MRSAAFTLHQHHSRLIAPLCHVVRDEIVRKKRENDKLLAAEEVYEPI
jgi:hypothetical protein